MDVQPYGLCPRTASHVHCKTSDQKLPASFRGYSSTRYVMEIKRKDSLDSAFWMALAFHILSKLGVLCVTGCPPLSLVQLKQLSSLKALEIIDSSDAFCLSEDEDHVGYQCPAEYVTIEECYASGERLTHLLSYFPKLCSFNVKNCEKLTGFCVIPLVTLSHAHHCCCIEENLPER
jgi:hypothetical protein